MRKTIAAFAGSKRDFNRYLTDMRVWLKEHKEHPEMDKFIWVNSSCSDVIAVGYAINHMAAKNTNIKEAV